jgi:hypothetical protein
MHGGYFLSVPQVTNSHAMGLAPLHWRISDGALPSRPHPPRPENPLTNASVARGGSWDP